MRLWLLTTILLCGAAAGCGTTRWSNTARTATEQMLITDAIDRSVSAFDLRALAGKRIYVDTTYLRGVVDVDYLVSSFRQHALASGCIIKARADEAEYIVEIRAGAVGTDHHDVLFGIPATNIPVSTGVAGVPQSTPEIPLIKKTDQRAVAKIALFAYNRQTGRPVWQSGAAPASSTAKDIWVFGAGPFQRGSIYNGTNFAGDKLNIPLIEPGNNGSGLGTVSVASEAYFAQSEEAAELARRESILRSPILPEAARAASALMPAGVPSGAIPVNLYQPMGTPGVVPALGTPTPLPAVTPAATPGPGGTAPPLSVAPGTAPPGAGYASGTPTGASPAAGAATAGVRSEGSFYMTPSGASQTTPQQTVPTVTLPSSFLHNFGGN